MPNYYYTCSACQFEGVNNTPLKDFDNILECPECGESSYIRQFSPGMAFEIHGYCYMNHYGKKNWRAKGDDYVASVLNSEREPY